MGLASFYFLFLFFLLFQAVCAQEQHPSKSLPADFEQTVTAGPTSATSTTPFVTATSSNVGPLPSAPPNRTESVKVVIGNCPYDDIHCNKVLKAAQSAAAEFSNVVNIKIAITQSSGVDRNYLYPQSLVRQLVQFTRLPSWGQYDVKIAINHDVYINGVDYGSAITKGWNGTGVPPGGKYWFDANGRIGKDQIDLVYIILHELIHGVGFASSWSAYFYIPDSPYYKLVEGIFDEEELRLVTPEPNLFIPMGAGQAYITGFEATMIFDKFLNVTYDSINMVDFISLQNFTMAMQDFCLQGQDAFVIHFLETFLNEAPESTLAAQLFKALSVPGTLTFVFRPSLMNDSVYTTDSYLNTTYQNLTLLTGPNLSKATLGEYTRRSNWPGLTISHLADQYANTPDFIMTGSFVPGITLSDLVNSVYQNVPVITYNDTLVNGTTVTKVYKSPIGPGVLRVLDAIGYSTVLARTDSDRETIDDESNTDKAYTK
ncbi:hypothetical protein BX666DRAFT_2019991 [Dichotomocladium elegans]|nr:hypothetical protein BX666DRAFT_2019991 [Dichotomocladium elegans]